MNNTWDLSLIYKNDEDIKKDIKKINTLLDEYNMSKNEKDINLDRIISISEEIFINISRLFAYSNMKRDEDTTVPKNQKLALEIDELYAKTNQELSSFEPLILSIDENKIDSYINNTKRTDFKQVVERILRNKEHILSETEEIILSVTSDISSDTENSFYMLSYADMKFPIINSDIDKKELTHSNYESFQISKNRDVRKESFEKMHDTHKMYANTFAANYYGHVKAKEKIAKLRNFNSNIEQELFNDNVELQVYDTLIEAIHEYIPVLSKYMDIKKKYLGLDEISNYDLYVPIIDADNSIYTYEDSKNIVIEALKPLGKEYGDILKKGFEDRWIDVYPKSGKKSGAYSFGAYDTNPYILLNHNDNMSSLFTLAHEIGHSIHSYYSRKNNPYFQSDYTIFVAEVASTTNELLLFNHLIKNTKSENQKKNILVYNMEQFRTTVFRQTMFAEFENIVHEKVRQGNALTAENLNEIYYELNKTYYPTIKLDDKIALEWTRIPHFYSDFYVYKYATGFISATFLSKSILENEKNVSSYINFLKDGNKHYPVEQLQIAGVDIIKKHTMCKALDVFKNNVENFNN